MLLVAVPQPCLQCSPMACPVFSPSPAGPDWTPKLLSSPHVVGNGQWCPLVSPARSAHPTGMQWDGGAEGRTWVHLSYPGLLASASSCCAAPCCSGCTTNHFVVLNKCHTQETGKNKVWQGFLSVCAYICLYFRGSDLSMIFKHGR